MNIIFNTISWGVIGAVSGHVISKIGNVNDLLLLVTTTLLFCIGCIKGYTNKDLVTLLI